MKASFGAFALAASVLASGCSTARVTTTTPAAVAQAQRTHEYPGPPLQQSAVSLPTAPAAIEAFATGYINWTAATLPRRMRELEALSIGQARSAVALEAAQSSSDYELARGGIANAGTVRAIAPLLGSADRYVVVTLERTTASDTAAYDGLKPAWHLSLATVARVGNGWTVSAWQPES